MKHLEIIINNKEIRSDKREIIMNRRETNACSKEMAVSSEEITSVAETTEWCNRSHTPVWPAITAGEANTSIGNQSNSIFYE